MKVHALVALTLFSATQSLADNAFNMVALGDSITTAVNATGLGNNRAFSFSTGSDVRVDSHAQRFARTLQVEVTATNVAKAGAVTTDLAGQWSKVKDQSIDYATLLIGANDACSWEPSEAEDKLFELRENVEWVIRDMLERNPTMVVNLLPLPNLAEVERLGRYRSGCQFVWDLMPMCDRLLDSSRTEAQRQGVQAMVERINEQYEQISQLYANVIFNPGLASVEFTRDDISDIDCFHPSLQGQQRIAEESWNAMFPNGDEDVQNIKPASKKK